MILRIYVIIFTLRGYKNFGVPKFWFSKFCDVAEWPLIAAVVRFLAIDELWSTTAENYMRDKFVALDKDKCCKGGLWVAWQYSMPYGVAHAIRM